jgi:hypothetical protein
MSRKIGPRDFRGSLAWRLGLLLFLGFLLVAGVVLVMEPRVLVLGAWVGFVALVGWFTAQTWAVRVRFDEEGVHFRTMRDRQRWSVRWEDAERAERQVEVDAENRHERLYLKRRDGSEVELTGGLPFSAGTVDRMVASLHEAGIVTTTLPPC